MEYTSRRHVYSSGWIGDRFEIFVRSRGSLLYMFYMFYVKVLSARALNRNGIDDTIIQLRLDSSKRMRA